MNKAINRIISDFKSKNVSVMAVEKALGFSNGMIGKAAKGKYIMSTQKINALLEYYGNHFPSLKDEVVKMLETATNPVKKSFEEYRAEIEKLTGFRLWSYEHDAPKFKEGGFYNFYKGEFVYLCDYKDFYEWAEKAKKQRDNATFGFAPTIPLNKEDEKQNIEYKSADKMSYDGPKPNLNLIDEAGQWQEPYEWEKKAKALKKYVPKEQRDKKLCIGTDNICPISKEQCDDETCTPGAECNVSGSSIQKDYVADETKSVISGVSKKGISEVKIIPPIPVREKGESGIDFSIRLAEFKEKNKLK